MDSDEVLRSQDTLFEEGSGHWTSEVEGEMDEDRDIAFLQYPTTSKSTTEGEISDNQNPVMDTGNLGNLEKDHNKEIQNEAENPIPRHPRCTQTKRIIAEPTRRLTRVRHPTRAIIESRMYQEEEEKARQSGEQWAGNLNPDEVPLIPEDEEENKEITALIAQNEPLAKEPDNKWEPKWFSTLLQTKRGRWSNDGLVIALAAYYGLDVWAGNFAAAYLNAKPQTTNYLRIPEGYEKHYGL
ncbi:hypothetical protein F5878DRAFT_643758 [Lentinula raphanica]|uniref:Uncharacterized protein n=1 Tax=Lentinula raphanica TaxID=153919 RepID=A0AA38UBL9_9AGAR|nr:hypothetical protein F5878DRAFT_643758 [Lentinula raphanica]